MASIINCDGPHADPVAAVFLITMIGQAETIGLCPGCGCDWASALLTQLDPARLAPARPPRKTRPKTAPAVADDSKGGEGSGRSRPPRTGQAERIGT